MTDYNKKLEEINSIKNKANSNDKINQLMGFSKNRPEKYKEPEGGFDSVINSANEDIVAILNNYKKGSKIKNYLGASESKQKQWENSYIKEAQKRQSEYSQEITKLTEKQQLGIITDTEVKQLDEYREKIGKVSLEIQELEKLKEKARIASYKKGHNAEIDRINEEIKARQKEADELKKILEDRNTLFNNQGEVVDFQLTEEQIASLEPIFEKLGITVSDTGMKYSELQNAVAQADQELDKESREIIDGVVVGLNEQARAQREVTNETKKGVEVNKEQNEQLSKIEGIKNRIAMFTGFYGALNLTRRAVRQAITTIKELDEQMTQMAVVTSSTISDYWKQLPEYTRRANEFGMAIKDVYAADTLYYQQGLKTQQVIEVSNETLKLARIAALDTAEATDRLTAAMRGFSMVVGQESAERVNDVFSKLAAITASNVEEISKAMTKTASIAHSAGMEFETTAAFLSQIIETTRESAETAGTAMKTVIARFGELKKVPSEIGEVEGEIVDANKIETALRSVGIALRDAQGQFRDLDDVFLELSAKWGGLDKNTQRYIATIAAGSRQQSRFIAMMQNYSRTMELVSAANNSAGTSTEQFAKTMDSLKNKLNGLKNAWDTFTMGILQSDVFKYLVDAGTAILNVINQIFKLIDKLDIPILSAAARLGALIGLMYGLKKVINGYVIPGIKNLIVTKKVAEKTSEQQIGDTIAETGALAAHTKAVEADTVAITANNAAKNQGIKASFSNAYSNILTSTKSGVTKVASKMGNGLVTIGGALSSILSKLIAAVPYILIIGGAIAAMVVAFKIIKGLVNSAKFNSQEEKIKRDKEALESYKKAVEETKSAIEELSTAQENYQSLVNDLNKLTVGTSEWKNQLIKVNDEVLNLVKNYKELTPFVNRNSVTGQLSISDAGWTAVSEKQKRDLEKIQRLEIRQQRKVYQDEAQLKKQSFIRSYGHDLSIELFNKSTEELQNLLLDNNSIEALSETFGESQNTIRGAISQLIENREAMQLNTEQLNILSQSIDTEEENTAPQIAIERRVDEKLKENYSNILEQFRKGSTYEFNDIFKQIAREYGVDEMTIKGKGDKELLAGIAGIVEGLSWKEGVEKYSSQTGWWSGTRGDMEAYVVKTYLEKKYTDEVTEDKDFAKSYTKTATMFLNGDIGNIPIEDLRNMSISQADINAGIKAGVLDKQQYSGIIDNSLEEFLYNVGFGGLVKGYDPNMVHDEGEAYKEIQKAYEAGEDLADAIRNLYKKYGKEISEQDYENIKSHLKYDVLDPDKVAEKQLRKIYSGYFESYVTTPYGESYYDPNKSKYSKELQNSFEQLTSTTQQALLNRIDRMWQRNGQDYTRLGVFNDLYGGMTSNLSGENERKFADILNLYDWTNKDDLEKMRVQLKKEKDTFGYTESQIDRFVDELNTLNKAVKKIDLTELINGLNTFGNIVNQLRTGVFEGKFSEEEYKKMIENYSHLFNPEDFVKTLEGAYIFNGTNEELQRRLSSTFDIPVPAKELVDATGQQLGVFEKIGETKEIYAETVHALQDSLKDTLGKMPEETRNAIIDGLGLSGIWDMAQATPELIEAVRTFYETWVLKQDENKDAIAHFDELRGQALGVAQENAYQLTQKYTKTGADTLLAQLKGNAAISEADIENYNKLNQIMAEGGDRAAMYRGEWNKLVTRLANAAGVNKAATNMKNSASKIKSALDSIGDSAVDTHLELNEIQETLTHFHIQGIEDLDYKLAEAYKSLFGFIKDGNEEAYNNLIQLVSLSNGGMEDSIKLMKEESSLVNDTTGNLTKLALLFENLGFGHIDAEKMNFHFDDFQAFLDELNGEDKGKDENPWENPYDWLWNINEAINKQIYLRERLERKYKMAVEDSTKATQDLYEISEKELANLKYQAELEKVKGENARTELKMLMDEYKDYAKYVSVNQATGQVQVDYEALDKTGWDSDRGSAFESFVSRVSELAETSKDSITALEDIYDQVKEIRDRGREQYLALENRVKEDLIKERQAEIDSISAINESIQKAQNDMLESMREQIDETRRIRENTDKQKDIEEKRQRLAYLQRDTSGANQVEILTLQEEINKDELSYADTLVDQSLQNIQTENEKAAEARQQQIDIMNFQLKVWEESGEIWNSVEALMNGYFEGGKAMTELIKKQENWVGLSRLQKENFEDELTEQGKLAQLFHENNLHDDASELLTEIEATTNSLNKLYEDGAIGNVKLDDGKWIPVTLKDYNPKGDDDSSKSGLGKILSDIFALLRDSFLPKLTGTKGSDNQRADYLASIGQNLQRGNKGTLRQLELVMGGEEGDIDLLSIEGLIELDQALRKYKNIFTTEAQRELQTIYKKWAATLPKNKEGGLNTYTGPAWLDGTPTKPEAVLNADQTRAFYALVNGVSALTDSTSHNNGGDNYFDININVDELASDYDVDQLADRIRQTILEDSQYRNVNFVAALR